MSERVIYADDDSVWGICRDEYIANEKYDPKVETKGKNKVISVSWLLQQVYNPAIANQRRGKKQ